MMVLNTYLVHWCIADQQIRKSKLCCDAENDVYENSDDEEDNDDEISNKDVMMNSIRERLRKNLPSSATTDTESIKYPNFGRVCYN